MKRPELGAIACLLLVTVFLLFATNPVIFTLSGILAIAQGSDFCRDLK